MAIKMQAASRKRVKLRLSVSGASGSGKTMSSLLLMYGLLKAEHPDWSDEEVWSHICVIDTENESASLYVGVTVDGVRIGVFQVINMVPPYEAKNYVEAIQLAAKGGMLCRIAPAEPSQPFCEGGEHPVLREARRQLEAYFAGRLRDLERLHPQPL